MQVFNLADIVDGNWASHAQAQCAVDLLAEEGDGHCGHAGAVYDRVNIDVLMREQLNARLDLAREMDHVRIFDVVDGIEVEGWSCCQNRFCGCNRLAVLVNLAESTVRD